MSREILFRGKRLDNGEWIKGDLINDYERIFIIQKETPIWVNYIQKEDETYSKQIRVIVFEVAPETVGQFSGEKDCKGNNVFSGHILRLTYDGYSFNCEVVFKDGGFLVFKDNAFSGGDADMTLIGWLKHDDYKFEIIGNIHDNPELIRKEANNV